MSTEVRGPVVIDTGVFAARLTLSGNLLASRYRPLLEGRPAIISFITVAELGYGARLAGWGPGRLQRLDYEIARAEIVWPGPHLAETYASLRTWCVRTGHGLGHKEHGGLRGHADLDPSWSCPAPVDSPSDVRGNRSHLRPRRDRPRP